MVIMIENMQGPFMEDKAEQRLSNSYATQRYFFRRRTLQSTENFNFIHDEWRYGINYGLMQDCSKDTVTFRHDLSGLALPYRKMGSFLLGNNAGAGCIRMVGLLDLVLIHKNLLKY